MKKQLIVTIIFLFVSVSALGAASYAWFSSSETAAATGININLEMPVNVMASLDAKADVTSLEGFGTSFGFGSSQIVDGEERISEYDMLVPVTSADGIHFAYLPFRHVRSDGCPKSDTELSDYQLIADSSNIGYFIDIPLYITTTNNYEVNLYVKSVNIGGPVGAETISGAVRCAVIKKLSGTYSRVIYAKDSGASPLVSGGDAHYPLLSDGTSLSYMLFDTEGYESDYYAEYPEEQNPYVPSATNSVPLRACEMVGETVTYHTTEVHVRIWVEGTDKSAVFSNAGAYFTVSVAFAVDEVK